MYSGILTTGLQEAARYGHLNILEFLLTKGFSVDEKNYQGKITLVFINTFIYTYLTILIHSLSFYLFIYLSID